MVQVTRTLIRKLFFSHILQVVFASFVLTLVIIPYVDFPLRSEVVFANFLPVCMAGIFLHFVTGRRAVTIGILILVLGFIAYINARKMEVLSLPLSYTDKLVMAEFFKSPELLLQYAPWTAFLAIVFILGLIFVLYHYETSRYGRAKRVLGAALVLGVSGIVFLPTSPVMAFYGGLQVSPWDPELSLKRKGLIASILQEYSTLDDLKVPRADRKFLDAYRSGHPLADSEQFQGQLPDIVIWLSESFFDPRILNQIENCDLTPYFCRLSEAHPSGTLVVPTYAGRTVRTEFELLTGVPMRLVDEHPYPYLSLVTKPMNSIAWSLRELGYSTSAIHTQENVLEQKPGSALSGLRTMDWNGGYEE